jgi:hypothetical protein
MSLHLRPETEAKLEEIAGRHGLSADDFLEALVERELMFETGEISSTQPGSGMVEENGLLVYRTGSPLPTSVIDSAVQRLREDRSRRLFGHLL